eukprot:3940402-Rhodomonas_salina.4
MHGCYGGSRARGGIGRKTALRDVRAQDGNRLPVSPFASVGRRRPAIVLAYAKRTALGEGRTGTKTVSGFGVSESGSDSLDVTASRRPAQLRGAKCG